ncbi:hypothetical protein GYH30_038709, partial [Glycine max]
TLNIQLSQCQSYQVQGTDCVRVILRFSLPQNFVTLLRTSLSKWKKQAKCGVWIKLPTALVNFVETAVKEGFRYHHAEPNYLMLVYWIIPETSCTNPPNASHRVRVGGLVLNDKKEVLVVQEKRGIFHEIGLWKIPTGIVEAGEELLAAAVREVKEETGVNDALLLMFMICRHADNSLFRKSELFFLCMLRPLSTDDIKKQDLEIDRCCQGIQSFFNLFGLDWMPFEEYAAHTEMHEPFKYENELCLAKLERFYAGFSPRHISSYFKEQLSYLYLNSP